MTTHERAVEVDTRLADIWEKQQTAAMRIKQDLDALHRMDGQKIDYWSKRREYEVSDKDTEASVRAKLADQSSSFWWHDEKTGRSWLGANPGQYAQSTVEDLDKQRALIVELDVEQKPFNDEYYADPWPRFFLVQNTGGHIHSSMRCNTTFPTTQWGWLPNLSGLTEADAVADQGTRLCSVCYPSAPVEWTLGLPKAPKCPGSGQIVERNGRSSYGRCPVCGNAFKLSNIGAIRAHKPAKENA